MNGVDSFFVSEGLEGLFDQNKKVLVNVNGIECNFISFNSNKRVLQFEAQNINPFALLEKDPNLSASIQFTNGAGRKLNYTNWSYKIEQSSFGFIITVGDNHE